jgi:hypothetical protein
MEWEFEAAAVAGNVGHEVYKEGMSGENGTAMMTMMVI